MAVGLVVSLVSLEHAYEEGEESMKWFFFHVLEAEPTIEPREKLLGAVVRVDHDGADEVRPS